SYRRLIDKGVYPSQSALAQEFGLSRTYVNDVIKAVEIFDVPVLNSLLDPVIRDVSYKDGKALASILGEGGIRTRVEAVAVDLEQEGAQDTKRVMKRLLQAAQGAGERPRKPKAVTSLYRKDKKRYAHSSEKANGALTITLEPGIKEAAGADAEAVARRIEKTVRKA
ncbi:unnamed protein product, partial [Discosporangium mesarthrocarpum]